MNYIKFSTIVPLLAFMLLCNGAEAQKKSETKLFKSVMAKEDTVGYNKFLAKYPKSVYAKSVQAQKDSLIKSYNTTIYSADQTNSIFKSAVTGLTDGAVAGKEFIAYSQRKNNVESIIGVIAPANGENDLRIVKCEQNGNDWQVVTDRKESRYIQDDNLNSFHFTGDAFEEVVIQGEKYLHFSYVNYSNSTDPRSKWQNNDVELTTNLLSLSGESLFNTMYSGERVGNEIFGTYSDSAQGGMFATPQINYLVGYLASLNYLKPANKERDLTREAIKWWYKNNPEGTKTLNFGVLEREHPIVGKFLQSKTIEHSSNNKADFFDIMGTTVLCVYNNSTKQYLLVWCEPQPKDPKKEKDLGNIYFEKGNTIVLYYYQGNKVSKERINLGTRQKY